jgi:hypothetical protein
MKYKFNIKHIRILIIVFLTLQSCSDNDNNTSSILDKWWYDTENISSNLYYSSEGQYEQISIAQNGIEVIGSWVWENENAGIMKIHVNNGGDPFDIDMWFKFTNIQNNTVTMQPSFDGIEYLSKIYYKDTDN